MPLKIESVRISSLKLHPRNVRLHPEVNLQAIITSLQRWKQQRPIIVDRHNQVIAGNGTLEAARRLKWTVIDVVRTQLDGPEAEAYAIADNKTTDLSEFDYEKLASVMRDLDGKHIDLTSTGFQAYEIEPLLQAEFNPGAVGDMPTVEEGIHVLKFTADQWTLIKRRIDSWKENPNRNSEAETDSEILFDLFNFTEPRVIRKVKKI